MATNKSCVGQICSYIELLFINITFIMSLLEINAINFYVRKAHAEYTNLNMLHNFFCSEILILTLVKVLYFKSTMLKVL